jgi:hypothetical protein
MLNFIAATIPEEVLTLTVAEELQLIKHYKLPPNVKALRCNQCLSLTSFDSIYEELAAELLPDGHNE